MPECVADAGDAARLTNALPQGVRAALLQQGVSGEGDKGGSFHCMSGTERPSRPLMIYDISGSLWFHTNTLPIYYYRVRHLTGT